MRGSPAPIGLVPAAGRGLRFPGAGSKEIFPIRPAGRGAEEPLCAFSLRQLRRAGVRQSVVMVSEHKADLVAELGNGGAFGLSLHYLRQPRPLGLPNVVRRAAPALGEAPVLLVLPDTLITPPDAAHRVVTHLLRRSVDLVLGVFPTDEAERLGPVVFGADGTVSRVLDKPPSSPVANTWGLAAWGPRFTRFCNAWDHCREVDRRTEGVLGDVFTAALGAGLRVEAVFFAGGSFFDLGTSEALGKAAARGLCAGPSRAVLAGRVA
jgi:dTDP-glucose pyrophosphorylase